MTEVIEYKKRRREKRKVVALMLAGVMVSSAGYAGTTVYADTNSDQNNTE